MRRSTMLVIGLLAAGVALFAFSSAANRLRDGDTPAGTSTPAGPQTKKLDWRETYGSGGERIVFEVDRLEVLRNGWRAALAVKNQTSVAWAVGDPRATLDRSFGLMLFATGDASELADRNRQGTLPAPRPAETYEPSLPEILEPGRSWKGTIAARGSLVAGAWVRVVFGRMVAVGRTPNGLDDTVVWITDHTVQLDR